MAQSFPNIAATDLVSASRANILARDEALKSNFAGTTYPTTNLVAGQVCFRTDLKKVYVLEQISPAIWREIVFASNLGTAASAAIGTSGDTVPKNNTANTWSALQTFAAGFNFGSQTLTGNSGSIRADTDLRLNALVEKNINFLVNNASKMIVNSDGGVTIGSALGNSKGDGSLNAVTLYQNGNALGTASYRNVGNSSGNIPLYDAFGALAFLNTLPSSLVQSNGVPAGTYNNPVITVGSNGIITSVAEGNTGNVPYRYVDITNTGYIDFTDILEDGYVYDLVISNARPTADEAKLGLRALTASGVITATNYYIANKGYSSGGADVLLADGNSAYGFIVAGNVSNNSTRQLNTELTLINPRSSVGKFNWTGAGTYQNQSGDLVTYNTGGFYLGTIVPTGLRLLWDSGSFAAQGKISVWRKPLEE